MYTGNLSVREAEQKDVEQIAGYWFSASDVYLKSLGVDISKMPDKEEL